MGLLLCYASSYISPDRFWPIAFFNLFYPYLLFLNILFALFWLYRRNWYVIISTFVILLGWNYLTSFYRINVSADTSPSSESIHILSYNVRSFNRFNWAGDNDAKSNIYRFIDSINADIVCLQEFYNPDETGEKQIIFQDVLDNTHHSTISYINKDGRQHGYGIATFSNMPVVHHGSIAFKNSGNRAIFSDIIYKNDTIRIYNCHLQSVKIKEENKAIFDTLKVRYTNRELTEIKNVWQKLKIAYIIRARQADKLHAHIEQSPHPVIICGDFNDTPFSYTYRKMRGEKEDAFLKSGSGLGNTYVRKIPGFRIDYIMYARSFTSSGFEIYRHKWSDHYPISCYISVKE
ncbi:MAG: hypothetical protein GVY19_06365 [Bacteroidetes bacterium]|nr:hypothetical protein [Bacteroidota bacterium]